VCETQVWGRFDWFGINHELKSWIEGSAAKAE